MRTGLFCALLLLASTGAALAHENQIKANDLLRIAVNNEKNSATQEYYAWRDRVQKPRGTVTKLMVNTPQGILSRTVAINDQPLSAEEQHAEEERGNRLLDAHRMSDKAAKQREDQQRVNRLLAGLPDAFLCEYAGEDEHSDRLACTPNPHFTPPDYETQVLQGMNATIVIDREDRRITHIDATLFRDVSFGWGIIGKLNRGGHIELTQEKVDGHWHLTRTQMSFDGHVLMVKPLHLEELENESNYRLVPRMSVAQALDYLRNNQ